MKKKNFAIIITSVLILCIAAQIGYAATPFDALAKTLGDLFSSYNSHPMVYDLALFFVFCLALFQIGSRALFQNKMAGGNDKQIQVALLAMSGIATLGLAGWAAAKGIGSNQSIIQGVFKITPGAGVILTVALLLVALFWVLKEEHRWYVIPGLIYPLDVLFRETVPAYKSVMESATTTGPVGFIAILSSVSLIYLIIMMGAFVLKTFGIAGYVWSKGKVKTQEQTAVESKLAVQEATDAERNERRALRKEARDVNRAVHIIGDMQRVMSGSDWYGKQTQMAKNLGELVKVNKDLGAWMGVSFRLGERVAAVAPNANVKNRLNAGIGRLLQLVNQINSELNVLSQGVSLRNWRQDATVRNQIISRCTNLLNLYHQAVLFANAIDALEIEAENEIAKAKP